MLPLFCGVLVNFRLFIVYMKRFICLKPMVIQAVLLGSLPLEGKRRPFFV